MPTPLEQLKEDIVWVEFEKKFGGFTFASRFGELTLWDVIHPEVDKENEVGIAIQIWLADKLNEYAEAYHSQKLQEYKDKLN